MTIPDIVLHRLHSQRLTGHKFKTPAEAVATLGAVQAQDYYPALWALGLRTEGATEATIERAIIDRQIVRSWPFRGTIHFVRPEDIRWMLELSAPRALKITARHQELGLGESVFRQSRVIVSRALLNGKPQTRKALYKALDEASISSDGQRGIHILGRLAQEGLICIGPHAGKQQTFVLVDAWLPPGRKLERGEALAELARRYFASHGPATLQDFTWWSGLTTADAKHCVELVDRHLRQELIREKVYLSPRAIKTTKPAHSAHLLPAYDEYTVAYKDRETIYVRTNGKPSIVKWGLLGPLVTIDGRPLGTWKRTNNQIDLNIPPNLNEPERLAITRATARYEAERIAAAKSTVWASGCNSYYLDAQRVPVAWPWTIERFYAELAAPKLADFELG